MSETGTSEAVPDVRTEAISVPIVSPDVPSALTIRGMIEEAAAIVRAAEERRTARRELRALIESVEREAGIATTEEDYPAADWLRKEAKRLRKSAFGATAPDGKPAQLPSVSQTAPAAPTPEPIVAPMRDIAPLPAIPAVAKGDLAHWFSRWAEIQTELPLVDDKHACRRHALDARAVLCGVHAYIIRTSHDPSSAKSLKEARNLRARVETCLKTLGWPWEAPSIHGSDYDDRTRAAHVRRLSDGYCRSALACMLFDDDERNETITREARAYRMGVALSTMQYHRSQLRSLGVNDELVDDIVRDMESAAAKLGVELSPPIADDETPPHTSAHISQLIGDSHPPSEPVSDERDPRDAAIEAILTRAQSREGFGAEPDRMEEDRAAILPLLDEAFRLGVPQSNKLIRDALLHRWPSILDGQSNYTVFLREVRAEIARRMVEANGDTDETASHDGEAVASDVDSLVRDLRPVLEGKRLLLLGGVPRVHTAPRLQDALGLHEVLWPEARKTDTPDKFESEMRRADVIVIVKGYSRHAASHAANEIARETGNHCVMLPAGYGVAQIISNLHKYFQARGMIPQQA